MTQDLFNIYNNFIKLTTNKKLYFYLDNQDNFSDRLKILLLHMAFYFKESKNLHDKFKLQEIYDFLFRQLELSIREIGYGDQSINKKMKVYINIFHGILSKVHFWDEKDKNQKIDILKDFINTNKDISYLKEYFDKFSKDLKNNTFNFHKKM